MNFNQLFRLWSASRLANTKPSTKATYIHHWQGLEPYVAGMEVGTFGRNEARVLLMDLSDAGSSERTMRERIALLRRMLKFAALELGERISPTDWGLKFPQSAPRGVQSFGSKETMHFIREVDKEITKGKWGRLPALISILTGMRIGEVCGLKWSDIDRKRNVIDVRRNTVRFTDPETGRDIIKGGTPKTMAGYRSVPLLPYLKRVLRTYGGAKPDGARYVIGNGDEPKNPRMVRESFSRFIRRRCLPDMTFHGLRHTYATLLVESGADIKTVSVMIGHSRVETTMNLYVHPGDDQKRRAAMKAFRMLDKMG